ncbi:MAG: prepilin-type N-terminal cleavage/methylation domain-containing protein [Victivallaceae bacterium]|nr:prepilin-type N-terminal cleavage/methylation domain-containing protein [Victivallaceae bacterium]
MHTKRFTLVELLVTSAIIVILLGMLFPAVHMARASGINGKCRGSQEQAARFLTEEIMRTGFLVSGKSGRKGKILEGEMNWVSYLYLEGTISSMEALRCPALYYERDYSEIENAKNDSDAGYAMDQAFGVVYTDSNKIQPWLKYGDDTKVCGFDLRGRKYFRYDNSFVSESRMILGACSASIKNKGKSTIYMSHETPRFSNGEFDKSRGAGKDKGWPCGLHLAKSNVFFFDGHCESLGYNEFGNTGGESKHRMYVPSMSDEEATPVNKEAFFVVDVDQ